MHPFIKLAVNHWKNSLDPLIVSSLVLTDEAIAPGGTYSFATYGKYRVTTDVRLVGAAWSIDEEQISRELSGTLVKSLLVFNT